MDKGKYFRIYNDLAFHTFYGHLTRQEIPREIPDEEFHGCFRDIPKDSGIIIHCYLRKGVTPPHGDYGWEALFYKEKPKKAQGVMPVTVVSNKEDCLKYWWKDRT